jgi:L-lactate dehydrogenase (cytochrome)
LSILYDEFTMNMRLIGARNLEEIVPEMVDASNIGSHIVSVPGDELYNSNCRPGFSLVSMFGP